jgi:hypothetical protein
MLIGYSFWGFLGSGILDTPDGGRSHRRVLVDGLRSRGHELVFLQANRDLAEAGHDLTGTYRWDDGLPDIDALFLEWRWPIRGRNTTACGSPGHTCDLHRQQQLLDHYVPAGIPTLLWDKDRQLKSDSLLRGLAGVTVCEPALYTSPGAVSLMFPVADAAIVAADPAELVHRRRELPLIYIGNQYDRDDAFDRFFAPAAETRAHMIAGKWSRTQPWPSLYFRGRIPFSEVDQLYRRSLATMLLLPARYAEVGHMTQRLPEAVLAGCLPVTPAGVRGADRFTPLELHVSDGTHADRLIRDLEREPGSRWHAELLADCLERLNLFRLSRQLDVITSVFATHATAGAR